MTNVRVGSGGGSMLVERKTFHRPKLGAILHSDPTLLYSPNNNHHQEEDDHANHRYSNASTTTPSGSSTNTSPFMMSPWNQDTSSPYNKSPWMLTSGAINFFNDHNHNDNDNNNNNKYENGLIGSLVREEGHIYSLAVSGKLLYTGSDSKNIRVWKDLKDYTGFKSSSGLVKTIVISGEKIFTGHQDGKIRVWKVSHKNPSNYKRVGSLPKFKDYVKSSMNPKNYVEVRPHRNAVKVKHFDAVSSLSLDEEEGLLYSGSWDKTLKVWRVSDSKCVESIHAHDDAVNAVVVGFGGYVFTGSADGTVKMWKREPKGKKTKHELDRVLLKQENAVTSLAVNRLSTVVYCGSSDGVVNYWERDEKNNALNHGGVLKGHKLAVLCLAAAGSLVFSGSADKNVCVWKREESGAHVCLSVLTGHMGPVKCIAVQEEQGDDKNNNDSVQRWTVYTGSLDKSVKVWRVSEHVPELKMVIQGWDDSGPTFDTSPRCTSSPTTHHANHRASDGKSCTNSSGIISVGSFKSEHEHEPSESGVSYDYDSPSPVVGLNHSSSPTLHTRFFSNNNDKSDDDTNNNFNSRKIEQHAQSRYGGASYGSPAKELSHTSPKLQANSVRTHGKIKLNSNSNSNVINNANSSNINNGKSEQAPSQGGASPAAAAGVSHSSPSMQKNSVIGNGEVNNPNPTNNRKPEHADAFYDSSIEGLSNFLPIKKPICNESKNTTASNSNSNKGFKSSPVPNSYNNWQNISSKFGTGDFDANNNSKDHLKSNGDNYQNRRRL
ncbi:hypothetical protein RIF29_32221 [Crotalaria pallida]|uniref:Uncharacterized protein n=1 Tax=Crotalaria pallida TaxID=3830 RepID=A0AAN9HY02_CROPI